MPLRPRHHLVELRCPPRERLPWGAAWLDGARLADPLSWLKEAITPTVVDPVGRTPGGRLLLPLGDSYMTFDPLGAQGANMGNRLSRHLVQALRQRGDVPPDDTWVRAQYDSFYERYGGPSMRWTHLLLAPMSPAARYLFMAQRGADGRSPGGNTKQQLADAFVNNVDDPVKLGPTLADLGEARGFVGGVMGKRNDWEALKGLTAVARRRMHNALASAPVAAW